MTSPRDFGSVELDANMISANRFCIFLIAAELRPTLKSVMELDRRLIETRTYLTGQMVIS
jgi:hypothetical protein